MTARRKGDRDRWARLRFAIIGPLLAAPPAKGHLQAALRELSGRTWQHLWDQSVGSLMTQRLRRGAFLSEVGNTSILRTGALHRYHYLLTWLPAPRLLLSRSGLEREPRGR